MAVSMYFPDKELLKSGNALGTAEYFGYTLRSEVGNYTKEAEMPLNNETDPCVRQYSGNQPAIADTAHEKGIKVFACTITPNGIAEKGNTQDREKLRREINQWMRTARITGTSAKI